MEGTCWPLELHTRVNRPMGNHLLATFTGASARRSRDSASAPASSNQPLPLAPDYHRQRPGYQWATPGEELALCK